MLDTDFFQIALHAFNFLLLAGLIVLCVFAYRYIDRKFFKSRRTR